MAIRTNALNTNKVNPVATNRLNTNKVNPVATNFSTTAPTATKATTAPIDQRTRDLIKQKALAGQQMSAPTPEKQAVYDSYLPKPAQPAQPTFDQAGYLKTQQDQVNSIYDNQTAARTAQFNAQRDKALGLVNQQKAEVAPQYAGMRNQTDVVNAQNVSRLREMMASNGISGSGENVTANVGLQSARQGALSNLNLQEQQTNNDFNRQITDINNPAELNAMMADIAAQRSQALYGASNRADEMAYSRGRDATMDGRYADETAYGRGQDTKQWDYQTGRDTVSDGRYDTEWGYQQDRDKVSDGRYDKEWGYQVGRDKIGDGRYDKEWAYQVGQDALNRRRSSGGGGSSGGGSNTPLPTKPTGPKIMTEQQYIDAYEEVDARHKGTARVLPGSSDYEKKMKKIYANM